MTFFKHHSARHRAETSSRLVRNTTLAAAAGAALIGSIAPAQAYAEIPAAPGATSWSPAASGITDFASSTYQAPAAQPAAALSTPTTPTTSAADVSAQSSASVAAASVAATSGEVTTQSSDISALSETRDASGIVATAMQGVGTGYVWGGTDFGAWDCSGFTQWVYAQNGIEIPRTTWDQIAAGTPTSNPQPGDLVSQNGGAHIGIYLGGGKMISALNPTQGTFVHDVSAMPVDGYYTYR